MVAGWTASRISRSCDSTRAGRPAPGPGRGQGPWLGGPRTRRACGCSGGARAAGVSARTDASTASSRGSCHERSEQQAPVEGRTTRSPKSAASAPDDGDGSVGTSPLHWLGVPRLGGPEPHGRSMSSSTAVYAVSLSTVLAAQVGYAVQCEMALRVAWCVAGPAVPGAAPLLLAQPPRSRSQMFTVGSQAGVLDTPRLYLVDISDRYRLERRVGRWRERVRRRPRSSGRSASCR